MDDNEKLSRCYDAWHKAEISESLCRVYGRSVGSCMDCGISTYRQVMLDKRKSPKDL